MKKLLSTEFAIFIVWTILLVGGAQFLLSLGNILKEAKKSMTEETSSQEKEQIHGP